MNEYNMAANNGLWVEAKKILMIFVLHMLVQIMQFKVLMGTNSSPPLQEGGISHKLWQFRENLEKVWKKGEREKKKREDKRRKKNKIKNK